MAGCIHISESSDKRFSFEFNEMANVMDEQTAVFSTAFNSVQINCEIDKPNDIYTLSKLCVNGSNWNEFECIYGLEHQRFSRRALGVWAIIVSLVGVFGNTLTLLSVPFAALRKRWVDIIIDYDILKILLLLKV